MASVTTSSAESARSHRVTGAPRDSKRNFARIAEQTWIWTVVGYSLLRFVVAWGAFAEHGANVWIFGLIDVGTAWPYGKGVALVCKRVARSEWRRLPVPLAMALAAFFAPYAYLWFAAGEMPSGMRIGMAICVGVLFLAATIGVLTKSRKLRREARATVIDAREPAHAVIKLASMADDNAVIDLRDGAPGGELVIDLTDETVTRSQAGLT